MRRQSGKISLGHQSRHWMLLYVVLDVAFFKNLLFKLYVYDFL
jgi:hypothetical protein